MDFLRRFRFIAMPMALFAAISILPARAQVAPSAYKGPKSLWVGAEFSDVNASFPYQSGQRMEGVGAFVDFHLYPHLGFEGDARFLRFGGFGDTKEMGRAHV